MMKTIAKLKIVLLLPLLWLPGAVCADNGESLTNVVGFSTKAEKEIARDLMQVSLYLQKDGDNVQRLNKEMTEALNNAVVQAKNQSAVEIRENTQTSYPRYTDKGKKTGWTARAEIVLQSKDFAALGKLVEQLNGEFAVGGVTFGLSSEAVKREEDELIRAVIDKFRQRADVIRTAMQAKGYKVISLNVNTPGNTAGSEYRDMMPMMARMSAPENDGGEMRLDNGKTTLKAVAEAQIQLSNE